jgi:cellulose synthase/poly-beta-1,6-N-acetylglucosamine synthase-like glycosyltransferase
MFANLLSTSITVGLTLGASALMMLSGFLLLECLAALFPLTHRLSSIEQQNQRITVLIPAHNEEFGLPVTIRDLLPQLKTGDRLVVIADNCTDRTAKVARDLGAIVLERQNLQEVGKGYALDYGLRYLANDPPDVLILIDADCRVSPGAIAHLTQLSLKTGRPAQATYLMEKPAKPSPRDGVSALAFTVKNLVRPLGLSRLNLPCLLTGTGMAFPWAAIQSVNLANGHLVEDMKLSLDLTIAGYPPVYCPEANIMGCLPQQEKAARSQRTRWEHGHLQAMSAYVPMLVKAAFTKGQLAALALAMELSVPPLSLLVMAWIGVMVMTSIWGVLAAAWLPMGLSAIAGVLLLTAILSAWAKFGRNDLPLGQLIMIPFYVLWKIPLYFKFLVKPQNTWVRTERDPVESRK